MTDARAITDRVDRYVRGEFDGVETAAFEAELLESPRLQDALEVSLGLQRLVEGGLDEPAAEANLPRAPGDAAGGSAPHWTAWAIAASIVLAATMGTFLWRSELENTRLQSRLAELDQPVQAVLTVPLDVMRSASTRTPDVRIRKPAGGALLILDVEVAAQLLDAGALRLELRDSSGAVLRDWSGAPGESGRIELALRTDQLPDGVLELRMSDPASAASDSRLVELLPAP